MRHRKSGRQLNRNSSHRKAMFSNMAGSLAKTDSVANRRLAFARTRDNEVVGKLFSEIGPRNTDRPGGYTRILKCGFRAGDNAPMAYIELVGRPATNEEVQEDAQSAE